MPVYFFSNWTYKDYTRQESHGIRNNTDIKGPKYNVGYRVFIVRWYLRTICRPGVMPYLDTQVAQ